MNLPSFESGFLEQSYYNNQVKDYLVFTGIILIGLLLRRFISYAITRLIFGVLKKRFISVGPDKFVELLRKPFGLLILTLTFCLAFYQLDFPFEWSVDPDPEKGLRHILWRFFQTALVISIAWIILGLVEYFGLVLAVRATKTESKTDDMLVPFIKQGIKIVVVILTIFFLLGSIYHLNIAALLGGAGIAGLAIALAAQETLGNLLGSFTIFLDKPFVVGDMVKIGSIQGRVEHIGFRSTRIRTLERSYVTIPNKKMIDAELDNLTERLLYRVRMLVDFRYDSKAEDLQKFIEAIKAYLLGRDEIDEGISIHLHEMTSSALQVILVFFVKTNDWEEHVIVKEQVIFKIMELANLNNLSFAYPSTSVYIEKDDEQIKSNPKT